MLNHTLTAKLMGRTWLICRCDRRKQPASFFLFFFPGMLLDDLPVWGMPLKLYVFLLFISIQLLDNIVLLSRWQYCHLQGFAEDHLSWAKYGVHIKQIPQLFQLPDAGAFEYGFKKKCSPHTPSLLWNYLQHHMGAAHYNQNVVQSERLGTKCLIQHFGKK